MPIPVEERSPNARALHYALAEAGVTSAQLARRLGVTVSNISKHRNGAVPVTDRQLARFLDAVAAIAAERAS